jgi:TPR repeat protein
MSTAPKTKATKPSRSARAESMNLQAHEKWEAGEFRSAFRLLQRAAKLGAYAAEHSLGYMYDLGIGVRSNRNAAIEWYRKSFRNGFAGSANNIGTIYRDEMKTSLACDGFRRP